MTRIASILTLLAFAWPGTDLAAQGPADPLPTRCFQRLGTPKLRHGSRVLCLAYAPNGQTLAAGGGDDPIRLWSPKTGAQIRTVNEPWVQAMAFTLSGDTLVFGGYHRSVRLWSLKLNKELGRLEGHKAAVKAVAIAPDISTIASGSQDGAICLWRWDIKTKFVEFVPHAGEVTALAFAPEASGNLFASAGSDGMIFLWDIETIGKKMPRQRFASDCCVYAIAFSADGKTLYSAGDDALIRRWDVMSGKQTGAFKGHDGAVTSLFLRGDTLISGSLDRTVRFWDVNSGDQLRHLTRDLGDCDALAVSKAADFVATAGTNNAIRIYDAGTLKEAITTAGPHAPLLGLALAAETPRLASVTSGGQVLVWNALTGQPAINWDLQERGDFQFALAKDGKTLAIAGSKLRLWNADTGASLGEVPSKRPEPIVAVAFAPDKETLAVGYRGAHVELWQVKGKKLLQSFQPPGPLHALAFAPDGKQLAVAGGPKIFLYDPRTTALRQSFDVKLGPARDFPTIACLAFGPDGNTLAAGGFDAVIRVYPLADKAPTARAQERLCEGHQSAVASIAFARDGRTLVSGSFDRTVRLWEAFSGKQIALFKGHTGEITGVAFAKDGRSVYSASSDTTVCRWDVPGLSNDGKLPAWTLGVQGLDDAWAILATEDTARGHDTMWRCVASAKQAIPHMLKDDKLFLLDPEKVKKLFRDLDSNHYPTRTAASNELSQRKYGRWMEGRYDAAMASAASLEYKRRVEILKEKLNATNALSLAQERLRVRRFMLICEQVANADAIAALQLLADKGPEEDLRAEAKTSLRRLGKK